MSASREKKKRVNQPEVAAPAAEAPKKGMAKGVKRVLTVFVAVVLVAAIVFLGMVSTGFFQKHTTAAVANNHKLSPAMLNYYYMNAYQNMQSYMGSYLDTETPLSEQEYTGEGFDTWADYMLDYAVSSAANTYAIYDEAMANGYTLSEDGQAAIDMEVSMLDAYATMYGYPNGDAYISAMYGTGCSVKTYTEFLTVNNIASEYSNNFIEGLSYTQEQIDARYNENPEAYDGVTFHFFAATPDMFPDAADEAAAMAQAEEAAKAVSEAGADGVEAFIEAAMSYDETLTTTLREDYTIGAAAEGYRSWIADEARQEGDTTYVANGDTGFIALYFVQHEDHTYQMPVVRHILVSVADVNDTEAMAAAKEEAETILAEYTAGAQDEQAFADLALQYSDDNGDEGGLIEDIAPGVMVESFENWAYDNHEIGDTGIIQSEYGYHVMYFNGYGETYQNYMVRTALMNDDYTAWNTEITSDVTYNVSSNAKKWVAKL